MRKLLEPVCLSFFVIMSSPCEMAFAEDVLSGLNNFEIARIERDIKIFVVAFGSGIRTRIPFFGFGFMIIIGRSPALSRI